MVYVLLYEWRALKGKELTEMIAESDRFEQYWKKRLTYSRSRATLKVG